MPLNRSFKLNWVVLICLYAVDANAQDVGSIDGASNDAQKTLVQQLGDPSCYERELAEQELMSRGLVAESVLVDALKNSDPEIRWRARRILVGVREEAFNARLTAFVEDIERDRKLTLPGWRKFDGLVGDTRQSREAFAAMTRYEAALLSAYAKRSPDLAAAYAARAEWLKTQADLRPSDSDCVPWQSIAALLFIGSDKDAASYAHGAGRMYSLLCESATTHSINKHAQTSAIRTLLENWVAKSPSYYGMKVALKYDLRETGLQQAKTLLEGKTTSSSYLHYAVITVGR